MMLAALAASAAGCDPINTTACSPSCGGGLTCNTSTGKCIVPSLEPFDGTVPGRSVRLGLVDARAFLATVDAPGGHVLVGVSDGAEPSMYVLSALTRPLSRKLALTTSASTVAVAWLGQDGTYRVGIHHVGDDVARWRVLDPLSVPGADYHGTEDFDVAVDAGQIHLAFHDRRTLALEELHGPIDGSGWTLDTVDDPADQADEAICSAQQRRLANRGLGFEPDVLSRAGSTYVAYNDGDCGDLRVAHRLDGKWRVTVVDTGDFERAHDASLTRGVTGRFASMALDGAGTLAIAYQDATRGQLLVAFEQDGRFVTEVADPGFEVDAVSRERKHLVGAFASLIFDDDDTPWVAYLDATSAQLRLAHRSRPLDGDGRWIQQRVDAAGPTGFSASLAFSSARGRLLAAEHLRPRDSGLESRLQLLDEGAL